MALYFSFLLAILASDILASLSCLNLLLVFSAFFFSFLLYRILSLWFPQYIYLLNVLSLQFMERIIYSVLQNYLKFEESSGDPARVQMLYERAITEFPISSYLWLDYTHYLDKTLKVFFLVHFLLYIFCFEGNSLLVK